MGWKRLALLGATVSMLASMALPGVTASAAGSDVEVSVGSPSSPFAQNKQNEPGIAIDAHDPTVLAAGSNDEIDLEACNAGDPTSCPFTVGVGLSGVYFSFDSGQSWSQPTYTGWTARHCLGPDPCAPKVGPIGTLPKYFENGLVSGGDPSLAFGPRPGENGFSWDNGSRLYYANLTANFSSERSEQHFKGFEAIAVSRTDDPQAAAAGDADAWMDPVIASKQNSALFADHEQIWADNAGSSPYFGNVYVCYAAFRSQERGNALPNPITVARSSDGGDTWKTTQISDASNNPTHGQQDCWVRTDSKGVVYVFWQAIKANTGFGIYMARSFTGGRTFDKFRIVSPYTPTGLGGAVDGVAGARGGTFPTADVANGAPTGADATDEIVVAWAEGPTPSDTNPGPNETVKIAYSTNGGDSWAFTNDAADPDDRPFMPAIAISPDGADVYLTYNAFHVPWQSTTANPRPMNSVLRQGTIGGGGTPVGWATVFDGPMGDARGSSANALTAEFLGDYNNAAASRDYGIGIYVDVRDAADCQAVDVWRQSLVDGNPGPKPAPNTDCPPTFGNTDIFAARS
ncbi:MAG TPA: sialidase family protein [Actinomycetota bacterium]|jgi:hypothetical protein